MAMIMAMVMAVVMAKVMGTAIMENEDIFKDLDKYTTILNETRNFLNCSIVPEESGLGQFCEDVASGKYWPTDLPTDLTTDLVTELPTELATELPTELVTELDTELPTELDTELPTELVTKLATELTTELPTKLATELPTKLVTELATKLATELPTKLATELPTELVWTGPNSTTDLDTFVENKTESQLWNGTNGNTNVPSCVEIVVPETFYLVIYVILACVGVLLLNVFCRCSLKLHRKAVEIRQLRIIRNGRRDFQKTCNDPGIEIAMQDCAMQDCE